MKRYIQTIIFYVFAISFLSGNAGWCTEPTMSDYEAIPIFQTSSIQPNIMVLLDNSGSMNFAAYGTDGGSAGNLVSDNAYNGYGYNSSFATSTLLKTISATDDDAQELSSTVTTTMVVTAQTKNNKGKWVDGTTTTSTSTASSTDMTNAESYLTLGNTSVTASNTTYVYSSLTARTKTTITTVTATAYTNGLRFQNVALPSGVTVTNAYLKFPAYTGSSTSNATLNIYGLVDSTDESPDAFGSTYGDISTRTTTSASVSWPISTSWSSGSTYQSADITAIIKELIGRTGWVSGNPMAFKIIYSSGTYRCAQTSAATLYITYKTDETSITPTTYYGYFNPEYFYTYTSGTTPLFTPAYKKVSYSSSTGLWTVTPAGSTTEMTLSSADISSSGYSLWDGNWMNWLSMRRIDVLKKVLIGGKSTTASGVTYVSGENPAQSSRYYYKYFDATTGPAVNPYCLTYGYYGVRNGYVYLYTTASAANDCSTSATGFKLNVKKVAAYDPDDFNSSGELVGILQRVGTKARWGNEILNSGSGSNNGGTVKNKVGTALSTVVSSISSEVGSTSTPLAESYYVAMRHFMQLDVDVSNYPSGCTLYSSTSTTYDPYYDDDAGDYISCGKAFVLLLTDGASNYDTVVPSWLKNYVNSTIGGSSVPGGADADKVTGCDETSGGSVCDYSSSGTYYLRDIAYYSHITDLRSSSVGKNPLEGTQNLTLYTVLTFPGSDAEATFAMNNLKSAAKYGGFNDKNSNNIPDLDEEWDRNGDDVPDNYYQASDGYALQTQLLNAINDILEKAASGTAVSVLATSSEGEGNLIQAYFKPAIPSGLDEVTWGGYIQSLWVDVMGNLREDTNGDHSLNVDADKIISYVTDDEGNTTIDRWAVNGTNPYPDTDSSSETYVEPSETDLDLNDIKSIWEGGKQLAERDPDDRKIFTYIDMSNDMIVDESTYAPFDSQGELVAFSTASLSFLTPYFGVTNNTTWSDLGSSESIRAEGLINFIRGSDITGYRTRTVDYDSDGTNEVWKLGDIIHSTPVSVSKPADNYHTIYSDKTYATYYKSNLNRETVVYVGANDGMLHAFTSGVYDSNAKKFLEPTGDVTYGDELWAYIPQAALPHLKWLADPLYSHVYYCDLKPKVFDAKIDDDGDGTPDTWKTLLLIGMNLGGRDISVTADFNYDGDTVDTDDTRMFSSSYTLLDITDPRNPNVLWERTYDDLGLTVSFPAVVKAKDQWFIVFGSGPSSDPSVISIYGEGASTKYGHVYVVDLDTGDPYQSSTGVDWLFAGSETNAFMNSPVSVDKDLDYSVDAIYFGEAYDTSTSSSSHTWNGKLYKVIVPWVDSSGKYDGDNASPSKSNHSDDPLGTSDTNKKWKFVPLLNAGRPITSTVALSVDSLDNMWVFVGSGRYLSNADKSTEDQEYMFGVKDPFYNKALYSTTTPVYYHNYNAYKTLETSELLESDPYLILSDQTVYNDLDGDGIMDWTDEYIPSNKWGTWSELLAHARSKDGWIRSLIIDGERIVTKFTVLGGIVFTPSFVPATDVCDYGGTSYLYGQYYETGTAYYKASLKTDDLVIDEVTVATQMLDKTSLGSGLASSVGVHVGAEGSKGFIQTSSGNIVPEELKTATDPKSGLTSWREK